MQLAVHHIWTKNSRSNKNRTFYTFFQTHRQHFLSRKSKVLKSGSILTRFISNFLVFVCTVSQEKTSTRNRTFDSLINILKSFISISLFYIVNKKICRESRTDVRSRIKELIRRNYNSMNDMAILMVLWYRNSDHILTSESMFSVKIITFKMSKNGLRLDARKNFRFHFQAYGVKASTLFYDGAVLYDLLRLHWMFRFSSRGKLGLFLASLFNKFDC